MQAITKARVFGWGQLALTILNETLSKSGFSIPTTKAQLLTLLSSLVVALSVHIGSSTSAGHPNGAKTGQSDQAGFSKISAVFAVLLLSLGLLAIPGCHHTTSTNPAVIRTLTLVDAENLENALSHGILQANETAKNLRSSEPEYYAYVHPKLVQIERLNEKANQALIAARNGDADAVFAHTASDEWRVALVAVGQSVSDPAVLTTFGFKNSQSQDIVRKTFAALLSGLSLAASYGGK